MRIAEDNRPVPSPRPLLHFAWAVTFDTNRTIGGGMAAIELLRRRFQREGSLSGHDHAMIVAVSRFTPGTNLLAYTTGLGWRFHGFLGSLIALAGASLPGAIVIGVLAATVVRVDRYRAVQALLAAGAVLAAGLVLSSAWHLVRPYLDPSTRVRTAIIAAVSLTLFALGVTPVRVLLLMAVFGFVWPSPSSRERPQET